MTLTDAQAEALRAVREHGGVKPAARALGVSRQALYQRVLLAERKGAPTVMAKRGPRGPRDARGLTPSMAEALDALHRYPSHREAAAALGINPDAFTQRVNKAYRVLRAGSPGAAGGERPSSPADAMAAPATPPTIRAVLYGELVCTLCNAAVGTIATDHIPGVMRFPERVTFYAQGSQEAVVVAWRRLRCARCRGNLLVERVDVHRQRIETEDWRDPWAVRRGRPPKWLVEQRRRLAEEDARIAELLGGS